MARRTSKALGLLGATCLAALVGAARDAPAAESFDCGPGGKPNASSARCECPTGRVEVTIGKVSRCVVPTLKPPAATTKSGPLKCASDEHDSAGHCCGQGKEWVPSSAKCVCLDAAVCGAGKPGPKPSPSTLPTAAPTAAPTTALPSIGPSSTIVACPADMVSIGASKYWVGSNEAPNALPLHQVTLGAYCLDKTEVTVADYLACAQSGACPQPATTVQWDGIDEPSRAFWSAQCNGASAERQTHPLNCVDWVQASGFCAAFGKRLPTEEEWEVAARGTEGKLYPWGNDEPGARACWRRFDLDKMSGSGTCAEGSFGATASGLLDMAGNVWEWTATIDGGKYVDRGGGWSDDDERVLRSTSRSKNAASRRGSNLGFRCAR